MHWTALARYWRGLRAVSSVGRAPALHAGCRRFESVTAHHRKSKLLFLFSFRRSTPHLTHRCGVLFASCPYGRATAGRDQRLRYSAKPSCFLTNQRCCSEPQRSLHCSLLVSRQSCAVHEQTCSRQLLPDADLYLGGARLFCRPNGASNVGLGEVCWFSAHFPFCI